MAGAQPAASFGRRIEAFGLTLLLIVVTLVIGWLVWSVVEWRHGRTASYRLSGLRVVRRDGTPVRLGRSVLRNGILCTLLVVPTIAACVIAGITFAFGASPPDGLFREPRAAPWDRLTGTTVVDERAMATPEPPGEVGPSPNGKSRLAAPRSTE
jgi:uncharacterized RDD family membrane protein YckC